MRTDLKVLRVKNNLTQADMAAKTNVSLATYNLIENGKRRGSQTFWLQLQQIFKLTGEQVWKMQSK